MTVTPIIVYFCKHRDMNPIPFLMSGFIAANCWSLALYIGNPTNIIVAEAYQLTFYSYSYWMLLPAVAAGTVAFIGPYLYFRREISLPVARKTEIIDSQNEARKALKHPKSAIFGAVVLLSCLLALIVTSFMRISVWIATLPFALLMLARDILFYVMHKPSKNEDDKVEMVDIAEIEKSTAIPSPENDLTAEQTASNLTSLQLPYLRQILSRMPWSIGPFIISMFILVEALDAGGWIALLAHGLRAIVHDKGVFPGVFGIGFITSLSCVVLNNQPMTILFTKIFLHRSFACFVSPLELQSSMFALVMGSNFGANFALNGALAGLMWNQILQDLGVQGITYWRFMYMGTVLSAPIVAAACLTLALELKPFSA